MNLKKISNYTASAFLFFASAAMAEIHGPFIQLGSDSANESSVCWLATDEQPFSLKVDGEWKIQESKK